MDTGRVAKVRRYLKDKGLDAILISNFYNILYLTSFKTLTANEREAYALITQNNIYIFTDARYQVENRQLSLKLFEPQKGLVFHLENIIREEKLARIGFEAEDLKYIEHQVLKEHFPAVVLVPVDRAIILIREIKDTDEIKKIKSACRAGDKNFADLVKTIRTGMTEKEIAFRLEMIIKEAGNDLAFDPIVAVDANAALPHYNTKTGNGRLQNNSVLLVDFGVKKDDYISDITRMIFMKNCPEKIMRTYEILKKVQENTLARIPKETQLGNLDAFCREELSKNNLPEFAHSTGHGVGLEIHEYPKIYKTIAVEKQAGQVITIEPGVYEAGKFGMRVEDTVVITDQGYEIMTSFSKDRLVL